MAKLGQRSFNTASAVVDACIVVASMALAFWLRFTVFKGEDPLGSLPYHLAWAAAFAPVFIFLHGLLGVYAPHSSDDTTRVVGRAAAGNTLAVMLFIDCVFVFRLVDFSRWLIILFWLFTMGFSCIKVVLIHRLQQKRHEGGLDQRRIVVVGSGELARTYVERIAGEPGRGLVLAGSVGTVALPVDAIAHLGPYDQVGRILDKTQPDEIVIALDPQEHAKLDGILLDCERSGIKVSILPTYHQLFSNSPRISTEGGMALINVNRVSLDNMGLAFIKRAFDVVGSAVLIVITSPIMLIAAAGTKLTSPGPVIFKQMRVGRGHKTFWMYKFRSMRADSGQDRAWTTAGDPRRTAFGAFMRRYSIDELPQLFNVLKGDMSLVGPRPEIPQFVELFRCNVPLYLVRHQVRPGMTGWAQVNGLRGDTSIEERIEYDLHYIKNWSLLFDLRILLLTPVRGIVNKQEPLVKKGGR